MLPVRATLSGQHWSHHSFFVQMTLVSIFWTDFEVLQNKLWQITSVIVENFLPSVRKMLPSASRQHFTNLWQEIFNDDFDTCHYFGYWLPVIGWTINPVCKFKSVYFDLLRKSNDTVMTFCLESFPQTFQTKHLMALFFAVSYISSGWFLCNAEHLCWE